MLSEASRSRAAVNDNGTSKINDVYQRGAKVSHYLGREVLAVKW